ncbi:glycine-rich cell wall structural protein-like, partial [Trifolium medium]|nr:glycine-rich cell wall structural protein-like [Trifolium medium]
MSKLSRNVIMHVILVTLIITGIGIVEGKKVKNCVGKGKGRGAEGGGGGGGGGAGGGAGVGGGAGGGAG